MTGDRLTILLKTHSSYSYLWPVIRDLISDLPNVCVLVDSGDHHFDFGPVRILRYDPSLSYTKRLACALQEVTTDRVLLVHDVDLVLNLNLVRLSRLLDICDAYDVDRLSLGVFNGQIVAKDGQDAICRLLPNMSGNFMTPFDYAPSIYRVGKLFELCDRFDETYQRLELRQDVQDFVADNFRAFGIQKTDDEELVYHRGFVYTKDFCFLHITVKGMLLPSHMYFDLEGLMKSLIEEYDLLKHISVNHNQPPIPKNVI